MKASELVSKLAIRTRPVQLGFNSYDRRCMTTPIRILKTTNDHIVYEDECGIRGVMPWEFLDDNWESWDKLIDLRQTKFVNVSEIRISPAFAHTVPCIHKLAQCLTYYKECGKLDRDIVVNKDGLLIDGYVGYLVAKMFGIEKVKVVLG